MNKLIVERKNRGEASRSDLQNYSTLSEQELLILLKSEVPVERTCAAKLLQIHKNDIVVDLLCSQLTIEKSLYSRIAISETLSDCGLIAIEPLMRLLGRIGKNQEKEIQHKGFYKISYPLPRDIAARTICRMGAIAIETLEGFLENSDQMAQLLETIDAYGHILYTYKIKRPSDVLYELWSRFPENKLLEYKIARCLSAFPDEWSAHFLLNCLNSNNEGLRLQSLRSLVLLGIEIPKTCQNRYSTEMAQLATKLESQLCN